MTISDFSAPSAARTTPSEPSAQQQEVAALRAEIARLRRVNSVLMDRVENDMSAKSNNAFTLFQAAITLENRVAERTAELTNLTHQLFQQISERCAAEKALLSAKGDAEKANLSKTRFLAAASHDLHQPLNVARLFLGMLGEHVGEYSDPQSRGSELVANIEAALDTVDELVRTLVDISRLDAGVWPVELSSFALQPLLDRLRQDYEPQAEAVGLRLRTVASAAAVHSDRVLIERVLRNFISNALRYTAEGSILIGCRRRGADVSVEIYDTGVGVAEENLKLIFEEFRQLGAAAREGDRGLGLGLAITERIARLIDAKIEVRSILGRGSCFALRLRSSEAPPAVPEPILEPGGASLAGLCVVVIDNDMRLRNALSALLRSWNCITIAVRSPHAAITALSAARKAPHLVIADYHLDNGVFGTQAVAAMRAAFGQELQALIVSSDSSGELQRALKRQGYDFLAKTAPPMRLRAMLTALASRRAASSASPQ
ncbi:histidine kinase [Methylocella silvestris BL2]|uniref:histidine kinase n=1 Tax=Methylocella silvestris (strain DSM 15510 / CIP 108128 / LMG 27833 / NCIMB 13906 / BL2) TaxID=395965 RepID=B8EIF1_METSB|nr:hybrid sensor histidine kinase/response regulator [Methylocella silvestris]ACK51270.1 histidine kinase [Methylocella silvestris BL2]